MSYHPAARIDLRARWFWAAIELAFYLLGFLMLGEQFTCLLASYP